MDFKQHYKTILTICIGFLILFLFTQAKWLLWVVLSIGLLGLTSSYMAKKIHEYWMLLGTLLSYIVPPVLLTIIFFCILFPVALLSRLFGEKDPLQLKNKGKSTFQKVSKITDNSSFEKPW